MKSAPVAKNAQAAEGVVRGGTAVVALTAAIDVTPSRLTLGRRLAEGGLAINYSYAKAPNYSNGLKHYRQGRLSKEECDKYESFV